MGLIRFYRMSNIQCFLILFVDPPPAKGGLCSIHMKFHEMKFQSLTVTDPK